MLEPKIVYSTYHSAYGGVLSSPMLCQKLAVFSSLVLTWFAPSSSSQFVISFSHWRGLAKLVHVLLQRIIFRLTKLSRIWFESLHFTNGGKRSKWSHSDKWMLNEEEWTKTIGEDTYFCFDQLLWMMPLGGLPSTASVFRLSSCSSIGQLIAHVIVEFVC